MEHNAEENFAFKNKEENDSQRFHRLNEEQLNLENSVRSGKQ